MCLIHNLALQIMVCRRASMWTRIYTKHTHITSSSPYNPLINLHNVNWNILKRLKNITVSRCSVVHASFCCDGIPSRRIEIMSSPFDTMIHAHINEALYSHNPREDNRRAMNQEGGCALSRIVTWLFDL